MDIRVRLLVLISYIAMIIVNAMANIVPINDITTGGVSDLYRNFFTPAPITFSIWGLIYLLLAGYVIYQFFIKNVDARTLNRIGLLFIISSLSNSLWIFAWHHLLIGLSLTLIIIMFLSLGTSVRLLKSFDLNKKNRIFLRLPFSFYFGWITVATIANTTAFLVSIDWNGFGLEESIWTCIIIMVGALLGSAFTLINRDHIYGLVIIWAYAGIFIRHTSDNGFAFVYPEIIITIVIAFILIFASIIISIIRSTK